MPRTLQQSVHDPHDLPVAAWLGIGAQDLPLIVSVLVGSIDHRDSLHSATHLSRARLMGTQPILDRLGARSESVATSAFSLEYDERFLLH